MDQKWTKDEQKIERERENWAEFWAGAEGRKLAQGRLRAAAVGRIFQKKCPLRLFLTFF